MSAIDIVRFKVKPGKQQDFIAAQKKVAPKWEGLIRSNLIQVGERGFCLVSEFKDAEALTAARPAMMKSLEGVREYLGLIHPKIGVAQAMSGPVVAKVK